MLEKVKKYDRIYSLGLNCSCKTYMRSNCLGAKRGPFDWLSCDNLGNLVEIFKTDFSEFLLRENLIMISGSEEVSNFDSSHKFMSKIYDKKTNNFIIHEFPEMKNDKEIDQYYQNFKEKYDGIVDQFRKDLKSNLEILFLLNLGEPWLDESIEEINQNKKNIEDLYYTLCKYRNKSEIELNVISYQDEYKNLILPNVTFYTKQKSWPAWDENEANLWQEILASVELKDPALRKGW